MRDILDAPRRSLGGRVWNGPTTGIGTSRPSIARLCRAGAVDAPAVADPSSENLGWHSTHDAARPYVLDDDGPCAHDRSPPDPRPILTPASTVAPPPIQQSPSMSTRARFSRFCNRFADCPISAGPDDESPAAHRDGAGTGCPLGEHAVRQSAGDRQVRSLLGQGVIVTFGHKDRLSRFWVNRAWYANPIRTGRSARGGPGRTIGLYPPQAGRVDSTRPAHQRLEERQHGGDATRSSTPGRDNTTRGRSDESQIVHEPDDRR
jgi:hypothetical protein